MKFSEYYQFHLACLIKLYLAKDFMHIQFALHATASEKDGKPRNTIPEEGS